MNQLPKAIICDLDGTLAILNRDPYDASKCELDELNKAVAKVVSLYNGNIILVSGREEKYRPQTESWLKKHTIRFDYLFMRPTGDFRKDFKIKREIFDKNINNKFEIEFVLDDRDQVVNMWRNDLKLPCFQVNYGNF